MKWFLLKTPLTIDLTPLLPMMKPNTRLGMLSILNHQRLFILHYNFVVNVLARVVILPRGRPVAGGFFGFWAFYWVWEAGMGWCVLGGEFMRVGFVFLDSRRVVCCLDSCVGWGCKGAGFVNYFLGRDVGYSFFL